MADTKRKAKGDTPHQHPVGLAKHLVDLKTDLILKARGLAV